jgi:hypothetical protein
MSSSTGTYSEAYLHETKGVNILAPMWTLTMITTSVVIARIYIRARIVKKIGLDDWAIVVGLVRLAKESPSSFFRHFSFCCFISGVFFSLLLINPDLWTGLPRSYHRKCHRRLWETRCHTGYPSS